MSSAELFDYPVPTVGSRSTDTLLMFAAGRTTRDTPEHFIVTSRMAERIRPMTRYMSTVVDECRHFDVRLGTYEQSPAVTATWFVDPPYQHQGGRWDRSRGGRYLHPNRGINYTELGEWVQRLKGQVIACEQEGASWLPWNATLSAVNTGSSSYTEVFWEARTDDNR